MVSVLLKLSMLLIVLVTVSFAAPNPSTSPTAPTPVSPAPPPDGSLTDGDLAGVRAICDAYDKSVPGWDCSDLANACQTPFQGLSCVPVDNLYGILSIDLTHTNPTLPLGWNFSFHTMSRLQVIKLSNLYIAGQFPDGTVFPDSIVSVLIDNCQMTGGLPSLPLDIVQVNVNSNSMEGNLNALSLTNIQRFYGNGNNFSGNIPTMPKIVQFYCDDCSLSGFLGLESMLDISILSLENNAITSLPSMTALTRLQYINLSGNNLGGDTSFPFNMASAPNLSHLFCDGCRLFSAEGNSVPSNLLERESLIELNLRNNNLHIDESLGVNNWNGLTKLYLSNNNPNSRPNYQLFSVKNYLEELFLADNQISGTIPVIPTSYQIKWLDLSNNNFTGVLPEFPTTLLGIKVNGNPYLSGEIPNSFYRAGGPEFVFLNASGTNLSGCWPDPAMVPALGCDVSGLSFDCHCQAPVECVGPAECNVFCSESIELCPEYNPDVTYCFNKSECAQCPLGTSAVQPATAGNVPIRCEVTNCDLDPEVCIGPNRYCVSELCGACPPGFIPSADKRGCELNNCTLTYVETGDVPCDEGLVCDELRPTCGACGDGQEPLTTQLGCDIIDCALYSFEEACTAGQYCDDQDRCSDCAPGFVSVDQQTCIVSDCTETGADACPDGTICNPEDSRCASCPAGYSPNDVRDQCELTDCLAQGVDIVAVCSGTQEYCPSSFSDGKRVCQVCYPGFLPAQDKRSCVVSDCTVDPEVTCRGSISSFCNSTSSLCSDCADGFESTRDRLGCEVANCTLAGPENCISTGEYCYEGRCIPCPAGFEPDSSGTWCVVSDCELAGPLTACSFSQMCNIDTLLCEECSTGFVRSINGFECSLNDCIEADPLIVCNDTTSYCDAAAPGDCSTCPPGFSANEERTGCILKNCHYLQALDSVNSESRACPSRSQYCPDDGVLCEECPPGTEGSLDRRSCDVIDCVVAISEGVEDVCSKLTEYCDYESARCVPTPPGYQSDSTNFALELVDCFLGNACFESAELFCNRTSGACEVCEPGYSARGDNLACELSDCAVAGPANCDPDTYCSSRGLCEVCALGYLPSSNQTACELYDCLEANPALACSTADNLYCPGTGQCSVCPPGLAATPNRLTCVVDDCLAAGPRETCTVGYCKLDTLVNSEVKNACVGCPDGFVPDDDRLGCSLDDCLLAGPKVVCNNGDEYCPEAGGQCANCTSGTVADLVTRERCEVIDCTITVNGYEACVEEGKYFGNPNTFCNVATKKCQECAVGRTVNALFDGCECDEDNDNCDQQFITKDSAFLQAAKSLSMSEGGLIALIVVGCILILALIIGVLVFWMIRSRKASMLLAANSAALKTLPPLLRPLFDMKKATNENWEKRGDHLFVKEMSISSSEYKFMQKMFTSHLDGKDLQIKKAYSLINSGLLSNFCGQRTVLSTRMEQDPSLFNKTDWMKADRVEARKFTSEVFQKRMKEFDWFEADDHVPIVPVIHGTDAGIAMKIAENGFTTLSSLDAGYYGSGIYFTSSVKYALPYYGSRRNPAVLICFAVPGNPYPVVEDRTEKNSLLGQPLKSGYQSHYVLAKKNGNPSGATSGALFKNVYDELVIGQESQVIPAFILEFDGTQLSQLAQNFQREIPTDRADLLGTVNESSSIASSASGDQAVPLIPVVGGRAPVAFAPPPGDSPPPPSHTSTKSGGPFIPPPRTPPAYVEVSSSDDA